ncbi:alpha/beta fold hydrolase [Frigidibacter sp. MR17.14]|uniref:alpha/beta fold hydrolase n=1 Tax=Frigidibacter sp. MR17.14 TaxID=3126509 RepID=UPI003012B813
MADSDPLLLLPGLMTDARLWWHQIAHLSAGRAIQVPTLGPGDTVGEMALTVLDDAPQRFAIAGHWLGAVVALEILERAPHRVSRIALLDINPFPEGAQSAVEREARMIRARSGKFTEVILDEVPEAALAPGEGNLAARAMLLDMAEAQGPERYVTQARALMRRPDYHKTLRSTRIPALVLCGEADTLCSVRRHELLAELMPGGRFVRVDGAGHLPTLEQPEEVTAAMAEWLAAG